MQSLISLAKSQITDDTRQTNVIELIETIIIYKFPQLTREELENMFDLTSCSWRQTRFYQDAKVEGKLEGKVENKIETIPRLSQLGLSYEQIAQSLELDINFVRQILEKSTSN